MTPNRKELAEATRRAARGDAEIAAAAEQLAATVGSDGVLVTRSEEGMTLYTSRDGALHVPAYPVKVRDVSGAGDTVAAVMAVMLAAGGRFRSRDARRQCRGGGRRRQARHVDGVDRRVAAPAVAVGVAGGRGQGRVRLVGSGRAARRMAHQGLRIGFTNGCFDLLHPGHVRLMTEARAACDRLVVGLNSDASVKRLKGKERPVQDQQARAEVLAALEAVDLVVIFEQDTPVELIRPREADGAGEGRRLPHRAGGRPRYRRSARRQGRAGRSGAGLFDDRDWFSARRPTPVREPAVTGAKSKR